MSSGGGRRNVVSDRELIDALSGDDPIYSTAEIAADLVIGDRGVYKRLKKLEDRGLVESKKVGRGMAWWLTDAGEEYLHEGNGGDDTK